MSMEDMYPFYTVIPLLTIYYMCLWMKFSPDPERQFVTASWSSWRRCDRHIRYDSCRESCVILTDGDGTEDQEVAVLYTNELFNCLWAEKAEHGEMRWG